LKDVVLGIRHYTTGLRRDQMHGSLISTLDVPLPAVTGERVHIEQVRQPPLGDLETKPRPTPDGRNPSGSGTADVSHHRTGWRTG
jgi:hypothetical protein